MIIHICHFCRKAKATHDWVDDITGFHTHSCGSCYRKIWGWIDNLIK